MVAEGRDQATHLSHSSWTLEANPALAPGGMPSLMAPTSFLMPISASPEVSFANVEVRGVDYGHSLAHVSCLSSPSVSTPVLTLQPPQPVGRRCELLWRKRQTKELISPAWGKFLGDSESWEGVWGEQGLRGRERTMWTATATHSLAPAGQRTSNRISLDIWG